MTPCSVESASLPRSGRALLRRRRLFLAVCILAAAVLALNGAPLGAQDTDAPIYVTRSGTFLISRAPDPYENEHVRVSYAPVGTVFFGEGRAFPIRNKNAGYREELYLPVVTEGGIRGAALADCLFQPGDVRLVTPQHFREKLSVDFGGTYSEFSRSDGLFAEITGETQDVYKVRFPFQYPLGFNGFCGGNAAAAFQGRSGEILKYEIRAEEAKIIYPSFYRFSDLMVFEETGAELRGLVEALVDCMDGRIFSSVSRDAKRYILENAGRFLTFLTGCGLEVEADLALRTEFFGAGGGLTLAREIKPKNRKLSLGLYRLTGIDHSDHGRFLVIKRYECEEGKAIRMTRLCMIDLQRRKCFDLLQKEVSRATDLLHIPKGDDISRRAMFTIREDAGHDDVFKLYRFILRSRDFRKFAAIEGQNFDYTHRKVRIYIDFIIDQVADFRRSS